MKSLLNFFVLALVLVVTLGCAKNQGEPSFQSLMLDRDAKKNAAAKKDEQALANYLKILETDSELPAVHSNIGVLFIQGKKLDEAAKSLHQALKLAVAQKDLSAQFFAHYNLGVFYGAQKKVPEALEHYQAALDITPTSKETKHNIELLIKSNSSDDQSKDGENKDQQNKDGKSDDKKENKDGKDPKDDQEKDKEKQDGKDEKDEKEKEQQPKKAENSPKYKPRPFQGDQLSEGDVKKILGELKNQEQKIRANFEKKERKENKNEKDW